MAIRSPSSTFTRFYVPDPVTEDFWSYIDEKLQAGDFKECEDGTEQSSGFASWDDLFDPGSMNNSYHKGEYVAFQFRVDQRKVPPIIIKQYVRQALQKYRDEHDGKWPPRQERQQMQENVQSWLLSRTLPQPTAYEIVWNPSGKWLLLGSTSTKVIDSFLEHFEKHFRLYPVPLYHVQWGIQVVPINAQQKDQLASMVSVQSQHAMEEGRFLGYEFLTWLWFLTEELENRIQLPAQQKVAEVYLGERIVMALPGQDRERVICTTQANALYEARTALQQGKFVQELQIFLRIGDNDYTLTLDSLLWAFKSLKLPKQMPDAENDDVDGRFLEKMYFLEEVSSALDTLYGRYLSDRLSPGWESDTLPVFRQWIERKDMEREAERHKDDTGGDSAPF